MIKKLSLFLVLLVLSGCASEKPMPQQVLVERPVNVCNTCSRSYTVRTPVQVVYKNTTYTTVYEPKTFTKTSYETVPYNCVKGQICR